MFSQSHIIDCIVLKLKCPEILKYDVKMEDALKQDVNAMKKLAEIFEVAWKKREILLSQ